MQIDVNNDEMRAIFLDTCLPEAVRRIQEADRPAWGMMSAQHMLEHLIWAFEASTGIIVLPCKTPPDKLETVRKFLYANQPTPHGFRNPLLGELPPPLRFAEFEKARNHFQAERLRFIEHHRAHPDVIAVHPIFGPLNAEEWHRSHYKHCLHHLEQFNLV